MLHLLRVAVIADLNGRAIFHHGEPVLYIKRNIVLVFGHTLLKKTPDQRQMLYKIGTTDFPLDVRDIPLWAVSHHKIGGQGRRPQSVLSALRPARHP